MLSNEILTLNLHLDWNKKRGAQLNKISVFLNYQGLNEEIFKLK